MTTTLYRIYGLVDQRDKSGLGPCGVRLLYVGITDRYDSRMVQHSEKHWWASVKRITREEFDDRNLAARAEREAIASEKPLHNRAHNSRKPKRPTIPKPSKQPERLMSLQDAADYLRVTERTIRNYIRRGKLPALRVNGSRLIRIRPADLDALLEPIPAPYWDGRPYA